MPLEIQIPSANALLNFRLEDADDTDDELPSEDSPDEVSPENHDMISTLSARSLQVGSAQPSSVSVKSFGLENDSYPSEDDSDLEDER
jgi:hypothetical protein